MHFANVYLFVNVFFSVILCGWLSVCIYAWMSVDVLSTHTYVCQEFHYRLRGSDVCLPCDCYPVGSFTRSCDPESGQCQCRPGVIGRQCNMCDNPFAEVTQTGCEGGTK